MERRNFLRTLGVIGSSSLIAGSLKANDDQPVRSTDCVLIDTTRCVGCRSCEVACAEANGLPEPDLGDDSMLERERKTSESQFTVVNNYETEAGTVSAKKQCMHCLQPACASACLTKAMYKTDSGPVIWREDKCMGCRFCMISCPFDMPKFEYNSAMPRIQKCSLCWTRLVEGGQPACVEACPAEALTYGRRNELLEVARNRIYNNPGSYIPYIYGEHEVGGTSVLYLSSVPFEHLGFKNDLDHSPHPELTKTFLYSVPVILLLWPAFLLALSNATRPETETTDHEV